MTRLGCGSGGWLDVKRHPWFDTTDWGDVLAQRNVTVPWTPPASHVPPGSQDDPTQVRHRDEEKKGRSYMCVCCVLYVICSMVLYVICSMLYAIANPKRRFPSLPRVWHLRSNRSFSVAPALTHSRIFEGPKRTQKKEG